MLTFIDYRVVVPRSPSSISTPARRDAWVRFDLDSGWHLVADADKSVLTACNGRGSATDIIAIHDNPPEDDRCALCERRRIERRWVERGLAELVSATEVVL